MTGLEQVRRERMAQRVRCRRLVDRRVAQRLPHRALQRLVADVVAPQDAAARIMISRRSMSTSFTRRRSASMIRIPVP